MPSWFEQESSTQRQTRQTKHLLTTTKSQDITREGSITATSLNTTQEATQHSKSKEAKQRVVS